MSFGVDGEDQRPTRRHPTERMERDSDPISPRDSDPISPRDSDPISPRDSVGRRERDSVRSRILYGGAVGLVATGLVAVGLAALFDLSFWAALGITALIGLGLAMLLAILVG